MGTKRKNTNQSYQEQPQRKRRQPSRSPEERENQLISLAMDLAEERLRNGTATSQEVTHFLKLGTRKAKLEEKALEEDINLKAAKTDAIAAAQRIEDLYANAISAFRSYSGQENEEA